MNVFPIPQGVFGVFPVSPGSQNVAVKVNPQIGHTDVGGLTLTEEAVLNVWDDGTLEIDREGIVGHDEDDAEWVSQRVRLDGKVANLLVRRARGGG